MHIVFNHGKESGPWGTKIRTLSARAQEYGHSTHSVDYTDLPDEPEARVERLTHYLHDRTGPVVLVGSSMGSYVATVASRQVPVRGLFLLAPALYIPGFAVHEYEPQAPRVELIHGWSDEIIPFENSVRFGKQHHATVHLLEGDHRLQQAMPNIELLFTNFLYALSESDVATTP